MEVTSDTLEVTSDMLFKLALQIEAPLYISKYELSNDESELDIYIDFQRGAKFACSECSAQGLPVFSTAQKKWRHISFFQYKCTIHMRTPRTKCAQCGVRLWVPPWTRGSSSFTLLFELNVMKLAKEMPVAKIAEIVSEHDTRIWRIIKGYVERARELKCFAQVRKIGVDETSTRKGHKYLTSVVCMDSREVVFATEGRSADTIHLFAKDLALHGGCATNIVESVSDMSKAYISGVENYLPNASITFNRFHVMKALNTALDEVRRAEQPKNPLLKKSRYLWLKNPGNLTEKQQKTFETLRFEKLKTARVYQKKLVFQDIYATAKNAVEAAVLVKQWLSWAVRSRLEPVKKFAKMLKKHMQGVLRYFDTRLTTGLVEGMNSRIQEIKRRAKGFRNINNFIAMIYLEAGGLKFDFA